MVEKIDNYNNFLSSLNDFETIFINVGDWPCFNDEEK